MSISLTLRFSGDQLSPDEITMLLQVKPHTATSKGDIRISGPQKKKIVSKTSMWNWKSEDISNTLSVNDHIERLDHTFRNVYEKISNIKNVDSGWVDICMIKDDEESPEAVTEFLLSKNSLKILSEIGLPVEFSIY